MVERPDHPDNEEEPVYSYDVWRKILDDHPEIDLVLLVFYLPQDHPHKVPFKEKINRPSRDLWDYHFETAENFYDLMPQDEERGEIYWGGGEFIVGVTSVVGVGVDRWEEWDYVPVGREVVKELVEKIKPKKGLTFLFIDFDIPYSEEATEMIEERLEEMGIKGYLLKSNGSYHFIEDELTDFDSLLVRYGNFLIDFAGDNPDWECAKEIGEALIEAKDWDEVERLCHTIISKVKLYDYKVPVELRFILFSLLEYPTLRISPRREGEEPPVLIRRFEGRRKKGLEPVGRIISESDVFCWMKPPVPKSA